MVLYAVDAGSFGADFTASDGTKFTRDRFFTQGMTGTTADPIAQTTDDVVYQSERWGVFNYNFPLNAGTYDVIVHMIESYHGANGVAGNRSFDVEVEGDVRINDFNPLAAAGHDVAHKIELKGVEVTDGMLTLDFIPSMGEANVAAIVVKGLAGSIPEEPEEPEAPAVPMGCTGNSTVGANDYVLFDGGTLPAVVSDTIALDDGWMVDEAWDPGTLYVFSAGTGSSGISFGNAGVFHGFKFTPPSTGGQRQKFDLTGADIYVQLNRSNPNAPLPTYGLRVIKPGEFEGNGGAPTTTWMRGSNGNQDITATTACQLVTLTMPQGWNSGNTYANRFIWEMKSNWNTADRIIIRRIVLKNFRVVP